MNLNDRIIETIEKHNMYLDALTKHLVEDVQAQKQNNYKNLVLVLGYTVYFTTWLHLRDFFPKLLMEISYFLMIASVAITVLTLMGAYFVNLIKNKQKNMCKWVWWPDMFALIFGFTSFVFILVSAMFWVYLR